METALQVSFDRYQLDLVNEQLWCEGQEIPLPGKAFAVLRYLVAHAGQLVSKAELFAALWPGTAVTDGALTFCIVELRKALGDNAKAPQFIETVHRRGYRFLKTGVRSQPTGVERKEGAEERELGTSLSPSQAPRLPSHVPLLVGRASELTELHSWLSRALNGERQIVFVTGEPGIGKTTLIDAFRLRLGAGDWRIVPSSQAPSLQPLAPPVSFAHGQCIEHYGLGEPYLPLLDALGRLYRTLGDAQLVTLLQQHAPTWLVQMPTLLDATDLDALQRKAAGATQGRMLRELAEALEALTVKHPLVLVLEDLHWSDVSTLDLLAFIARRRESARLLVIGSYRPVDTLTANHPLKPLTHELYAHQLAAELAVQRLSESAVSDYLTQRFPQSLFPTRLAPVLFHRTGGNPLFLSTLVQELVQRSALVQAEGGTWTLQEALVAVETWMPESVRHVLARQQERLGADDQRVLEAASVAGAEFSAAAVAAALETNVLPIEDVCGRLAEQQQFLRPAGFSEWPDGTRASRYGFQHALYQEFWHERVSVGYQQQWHLRIGKQKERAYGERAREIAAELAVHFEQGSDYQRAVQYLQQAGEHAVRRSANQEAIALFTRERELLQMLPDTPERAQQELGLLRPLGPALISIQGFTTPEVERIYARAAELCHQVGSPYQLIYVLQGLQIFHLVRGEVRTARDLAEHSWRLAQRVATPTALMAGHGFLIEPLYYMGELTAAREHLEQAWARYNPQKHNLDVFSHWSEPGVGLLIHFALTSWLLGYPDQAQQRLTECLAWAKRQAHLFSLASALSLASAFHALRQEWQLAKDYAEEAIRVSTEYGFPDRLAHGRLRRGRALVELGQVDDGIAQMQQGMDYFRATGAELARVGDLSLLAAAYAKSGRVEEGLMVLAEALAAVDKTEIRVGEADMYRLKGELVLQSGIQDQEENQKSNQAPSLKPLVPSGVEKEAEKCFLKAIDIARTQQAKSWELRAATCLAHLWQRQGKHHEAHKMLSEVYNWFSEGFDTKDLQEAKALLDALATDSPRGSSGVGLIKY